jgi:5-formyltetrahydrofolate cyclo-ligase
MPGEIDLACLQEDHSLVLGVTRTPPKGPLTIHRMDGPMETHPFGYLQPAAGAETMDPGGIEAVLVPGVLFSIEGGRLGHGRGYYDQLLSGLPRRPWLIGITVERRVVDHLPMTENDVWMDALATESGYRAIGGKKT